VNGNVIMRPKRY